MATLAAHSYRELFFQRLSSDGQGLLALDFDGTIAPFTPHRALAFPYSGIRDRVEKIARGPSQVVVISGRSCHEIVPLLGIDPHPEIWGCHGAERLQSDGTFRRVSLPESAEDSLRMAASWLEEEGVGSALEIKHGCVCVHWRGRCGAEVAELQIVAARVFDVCRRREQLCVRPFDGGLELCYQAANKAIAIRNLVARDRHRCIAYCGDDVTDEDAFIELGARGLSVLVRAKARPTSAILRVSPPEEFEQFLDEWLECCGGVQ
jgi:trehalose-phosphatase